MTCLEDRLAGYLAMRRALGYRLVRAEKLLGQFIAWLNERGETHDHDRGCTRVGDPAASDQLELARLSPLASCAASRRTCTRSTRAHELVPQDLLPQRPRRAVPYLYTDTEIRALMNASRVIPTPHRAATMRTLIGLLAVTGMRIGEAIRFDHGRHRPSARAC